MTNRAAAHLTLLDAETGRLLETVDGLAPADLTRDTLCPGWSVAHVLTHLARNAEALLNLVRWAADGRERAAYTSEADRDAAIHDGAQRPLEEIALDVRVSAERFRQEAEVLRGEAGEATARTRTGTPVTGAQLISMRLVEVTFHHVDLRMGYSFDDADPDWVLRTLARGVRQWEATGDAPGLTLLVDGSTPLALGGGGPAVAGSAGRLLLWLARGVDDGLRPRTELPVPPAWS